MTRSAMTRKRGLAARHATGTAARGVTARRPVVRRAARVDANQALIIGALRACGATVHPLHRVGDGCPDLLVGFRGRNLLMECKDGSKPPSARCLTPEQAEWHGTWRGQVVVVSSASEAMAALVEAPQGTHEGDA